MMIVTECRCGGGRGTVSVGWEESRRKGEGGRGQESGREVPRNLDPR